jgi:hypothetical protein
MAMTNQSEAQTIARIEELKGDLALNFLQICELLVLVTNHYLHRDPMFRSYRDVATGKLLPELVMAMAWKRGYLQHMAGRPREVQMNIARGSDLTWCRAVRGEIVEKRTPWKAMGEADFKRMFPVGAPVRTLSEQVAVLKQELAMAAPTHLRGQPLARIDPDGGTFRLGRQTVPLSVVLAALAEAGLVVHGQGAPQSGGAADAATLQ